MPIRRRRLLTWSLAGLGLAAIGTVGYGGYFYYATEIDTVGNVDFGNKLWIPPLAEPQTDGDGRTVFDLKIQKGSSDFKSGAATNTWGVNGDYLGPTLRATRGDTVVVNVRNTLGETTSLHWHGMHLPAVMDGGPHQSVASGDTWSPTWKVHQPAATLWYHPHPHGKTAQHVYRGVAGLFIIDDDEESALDLPREYGVDDIPLIVQDRNFHSDNSFDESETMFADTGILGSEILVNGTHSPYQEITSRRTRLRVLNGSGARVFDFSFADKREFALIGTDGGLRPEPHYTDHIALSPGERAEIVVEFAPGERTVLRSVAPDLGSDYFTDRGAGGHDSFDIIEFRAAERLDEAADVPDSLVDIAPLSADDAVEERRFELSGVWMNNKEMDMSRIDFAVRKDTVEVWELVNYDSNIHNFHVHDVQFQVLTVGGKKPPEYLRGWKDTVYLPAGRDVRVALRFTDYSDPDMPYMHHCHILRHEDLGLMGQFVVLDEGEEIGTPPSGGDGGHAGHHD